MSADDIIRIIEVAGPLLILLVVVIFIFINN